MGVEMSAYMTKSQLVDKIAEMRKNQDCYLSGRLNCAPIEMPPVERS